MLTAADIFRKGGPLERVLADYTERTEQLIFATCIEEAIENNESLICEAGTGTGKTYAYLVPAILSNRKIIISTGTRNLQDQLFQKDLPVILNTLKVPISTALLKGRNNYLCRQRLLEYEKVFQEMSPENRSIVYRVKEWSSGTSTGDISELLDLPENSPVRQAITSTTDNCLGQDCEFYNDCFVLKARRKAQDATLLVVNHYLLMADLTLKETGFGEILPKAEVIIFDEAHQLPELAATFFGVTLSSRQLNELVNDCRAAISSDASDIKGAMDLLEALHRDIQHLRLSLGKEDSRRSWADISANKKVLSATTCLINTLSDIENLLADLSMRSKSLENCWQRTTSLLELLNDYSERERDDQIQWFETRGNGFMLHQTPLDISGIFQERINQHECACIYTSATLAVKDDFSHFSTQLGLTGCKAIALLSPFDYEKQAMLYLPTGLPEPGQPDYTVAVVQAALPVLRASQGHAFVLFTSHRALALAAELLREKIEYPLLVQGEAPRTELLDRFRVTQNAVLLGTGSFWEGVDVKGESLSSVIIDKLPFMPPDDPVFRARAEKMQATGINPFLDYQLPQAIINLKQGIGRLIRDINDYGVLTICDPRIRTKSYGKRILQSLPAMKITDDLALVEKFYLEH